ncbi:MAG: hypothetical protein M3Z20_20670 [Chloroflexota bacterium]|nr:hypothetical protein [Chloroflexota bacterium]
MSRRPMHSEFGFTTGLYVPPARPRSAWRTLLFAALLALIPAVGPGISTVYVDRRDDPERFNFVEALATAVIQLVAVAVVAIVLWLIVVVMLGVRIQLSRG